MTGNEKKIPGQPVSRRKGTVFFVTGIAVVVVFVVALVNLVHIAGGYLSSQASYRNLRDTYTYTVKETAAPGVTGGVKEISGSGFSVDFDALKRINPDTAAWLRVPGTNIDYPVAAADDNEYYISHGFDGTVNSSGALFLDQDCQSDFSNDNTIIYGHNMKDGSMFAALHEYEDDAFFGAHPDIFVYTPDGAARRYAVFSAYVTDATAENYPHSFAGEQDFLAYAERTHARSATYTDMRISGEDSLLTLSTCVSGQENKRYVVAAVAQADPI